MNFQVELKNGKALKGVIYSPGESPAGIILLVHGIGEHIRRYDHWKDNFIKANYGFAGVDLPGHGLSEGRRGRIRNYPSLYEMIDILINNVKRTYPGVPLFLYGHSLGGGIVLDYLLHNNPAVKGAVITSPWIRTAFRVPGATLALVSVIKAISPGLTLPSNLDVTQLSHDPSVIEKYKTDPLVHGKIAVGFFADAVKRGNNFANLASGLKVPVLIVHGSDDRITSAEASREFCSRTSMAEFRLWEGGFHELHNEPFRDDVFKFIVNWINEHARSSGVKQN